MLVGVRGLSEVLDSVRSVKEQSVELVFLVRLVMREKSEHIRTGGYGTKSARQHLLDSCVGQGVGPYKANGSKYSTGGYGPIQNSWQHVLNSYVSPYEDNGSTHEDALWAHTGLPAAFVR